MTLKNYADKLQKVLNGIEENKIKSLESLLAKTIKSQGIIIFCGNGGSYANGSHIAGDFQKVFSHYNSLFAAIGDNFCSLSAVANDINYENTLKILIQPYLKKNISTLVIFLSGSGNSSNLVYAAESLKFIDKNVFPVTSISISGYGGGKIKSLTDLPIFFDLIDMEISEDLQTIIFHYLKQMLINKLEKNPENSNKYNQRTKLNVVS